MLKKITSFMICKCSRVENVENKRERYGVIKEINAWKKCRGFCYNK